MKPRHLPRVDEALWEASLLASDTEVLLAAAGNYLGPVRSPYDKRVVVSRLAAFLRKPDTKEAILGLLDLLDARITGSLLLLGSATETELRELFAGELPLFDLGVRLANLLDRLILFRFEAGRERRYAANPLLVPELRRLLLDPGLLFGPERTAARPAAESGLPPSMSPPMAVGELPWPPPEAPAAPSSPGPVEALLSAGEILAFFGFLFHGGGTLKKGGELTKRGADRAASLFPALARRPALLDDLSRALLAAGALYRDEEGSPTPDPAALDTLLRSWGERLPIFLAAALSTAETAGEGEAPSSDALDPSSSAELLSAALERLPPGTRLSRAGFRRWLALLARRDFPEASLTAAISLAIAAERLGLLPALGEGESPVLLRAALPGGPLPGGIPAETSAEAPPPAAPSLVAEGAHLLHLMPEAGLSDRLFFLLIAEPRSIGRAWTLELDRESVRRGFAAGVEAKEVLDRMGRLSGRPLPQSLVFSFRSWEEEYRSLRLYHGFVLAADERMRKLLEGTEAISSLVTERLAPGLYLLAARSRTEIAARLAGLGLEVPPEIRASAAVSRGLAEAPVAAGAPNAPDGSTDALAGADRRADGAAASGAAASGAAASGAARGTANGTANGTPPGAAASGAVRGTANGAATLVANGTPSGAASGWEALEARPEAPRPGTAVSPPSGLDPRARLEALFSALEALPGLDAERRRELADRIGRRLILGPEQLREGEFRSERLEAGGLDYLGKVRVVERALRSRGDRLEVLYRLPGADPVRTLLRPVRLDKTEKGLVLEAEDLATGGPVRVPLGAASSVRRLRASLFGEES